MLLQAVMNSRATPISIKSGASLIRKMDGSYGDRVVDTTPSELQAGSSW
jgi:hypothetical protein